MLKVESRQGGQFPQRLNFKLTNYHRRHLNITSAGKLSTPTCGHHRAVVRNVTAPLGEAAYICRACYGYLCRVEVKAVVRRQVAALFRNLRPRIFGSGGLAGRLVDRFLARALLAAYRDRSYQHWISLARLAARIAERGPA
jgi:hypothetical protein